MNVTMPVVDLARPGIGGHARFLADLDPSQVGFVDVGADPYGVELAHGDYRGAGCDLLARLDIFRHYQAGDGGKEGGIAEPCHGLRQRDFGFTPPGPRLVDSLPAGAFAQQGQGFGSLAGLGPRGFIRGPGGIVFLLRDHFPAKECFLPVKVVRQFLRIGLCGGKRRFPLGDLLFAGAGQKFIEGRLHRLKICLAERDIVDELFAFQACNYLTGLDQHPFIHQALGYPSRDFETYLHGGDLDIA